MTTSDIGLLVIVALLMAAAMGLLWWGIRKGGTNAGTGH